MLKVYCENNALTPELRRLHREHRIELVHFPYNPDSHTQKASLATPSGARINDLNLPIRDLPGRISDYTTSGKYPEIEAIVGAANRRDALHVDSAHKHGCHCFFGRDADIMAKSPELDQLLGIRFLHPDQGWPDFLVLLAEHERMVQ